MDKQDVEGPEGPGGSRTGSKPSIHADIPPAILNDSDWTPAYFRGLIRGALRQIYFRYPGKKIALNRQRVEIPKTTTTGKPAKRNAVFYRCQQCGVLGKAAVGKGNPKGHIRVWVDHIDPVVPLDRYPNWDEYVHRLFCSADNFEVLCDDCHKTKSKAENAERRKNMGWQTRAKTFPGGDPEQDPGVDE